MLGYASVDRMLSEMSATELVERQIRAELEVEIDGLVAQGMDREIAAKCVYAAGKADRA